MLTKLIKRNLSDEIINNIRISYCSGMKQFQIANDNNMPKSSVRTVIQRLRKYGEVK
jgi:DNA-binding transcriptional regulator LsrR (DeoR family)